MINNPLSVVSVLLICGILPPGIAAQPANAMWTTEDIVGELEHRSEHIEHLHLVVAWKDIEGGHIIGWDRSEIDRDIIGRIRYQTESGKYDENGNPVPTKKFVRIYDSKNTINYDLKYDPDLGESSGIDTLAIVHDRPHPEPSGPSFLRDPSQDINLGVLKGLRESISAGRDVTIQATEVDGTRLLKLEFLRLLNPSPSALRWTATIDITRGWSVVKLLGTSPQGVTRNSSTAEYQSIGDNVWLPQSGKWRSYSTDGSEERGWDFVCEEIKTSKLGENEELFDLRIPSGSYVRFIPLSVLFKTEVELADFNATRNAALAAVASQEPSLRPVASEESLRPSTLNSGRTWLFLGNCIFALILTCVWLIRRNGK